MSSTCLLFERAQAFFLVIYTYILYNIYVYNRFLCVIYFRAVRDDARADLLGIWNEIEKRCDNYERDYSTVWTSRKVIFARVQMCLAGDANMSTRIKRGLLARITHATE